MKRKALVVGLAFLPIEVAAALLGWSFTVAYYSHLGEGARRFFKATSLSSSRYPPQIVSYSQRVFEATILAEIFVLATCLLLSFRPRSLDNGRRMLIAGLGLAFPLVVHFTQIATRGLATCADVIDFAKQGHPGLQPGERIFLDGCEISATESGLAAVDMSRTQSSLAVFGDHVKTLLDNYPLFVFVAVGMLLGIAGRLFYLRTADR
jgi:hypothetical protein